MTILSRRSVLRNSLAVAAAGTLARPYVANAAATMAEVWWAQGFVQEEDVAFKKAVADYQKASGNTIELSIVPFAPLRQKTVSAVPSGGDPNAVFNQFLIAYGGEGIVSKDGKLHLDDPKVREATIKALTYPATAYKDGFVPPGAINWNDADDNNAFHAKQIVMDLDGTISTEVAVLSQGKKNDYDDILTMGLPLSNDGKPVPSKVTNPSGLIPKGAKTVAVAKDFLK